MNIRDFTSDDYQVVADIQTAIFPDVPAVAADYVEFDENVRSDPRGLVRRWVAEVDGRVVGVASFHQAPWMYEPHTFDIQVRVLPNYQRRGIGTALYDHLVEELAPRDPALLRATGREDKPHGVRFLEQRGFAEFRRGGESYLYVAEFDPAPYAGLADKLRAEGIVLKTLRELADDPGRDRKLYDLEWELDQDAPGTEDLTRLDFEQWVALGIESENVQPEGYVVAVHNGEYVGISQLWADRASDMLYTGLTGVKRAYRRRGVATALKVKAIGYAQAIEAPIIKTGNEVNNRPMLAINERLGFVRQPDWISFKKALEWRM